jgi:hypothetical protein
MYMTMHIPEVDVHQGKTIKEEIRSWQMNLGGPYENSKESGKKI